MNLSALNITTQKAHQFEKKGIYTAEDLIRFMPRKYNDFTEETGILSETELSCLTVTVNKVKAFRNKTPLIMAFCTAKTGGQSITIRWFNQNYMKGRIENCIGRDVYIAGKIAYNHEYKTYEVTTLELFEPNTSAGKIVSPVYSKIAGMSTDYLTEKIRLATSISELTSETCPFDLISAEKQLPMKEALWKIHFPTKMEHVEQAQERFLFDDLLRFALHNEWAIRNSPCGSPYSIKTLKSFKQLVAGLPYALTDDQKLAVEAMIADIRSGRRINALVQGDVGCGKSIVAYLMMTAIADSGYQSVIMAPTQVLAQQHYNELKKLVEPLGFTVAFLGGSEMKKAEKTAALKQIADGTASFIVGTHSVIGKDVAYKKLALTIADEEHKFGVAQRTSLLEKASEGVHSITMSATPIPRSLAQVMYGNTVQLHTIKTMPNGRKPVVTGLMATKEKLFKFILGQAKKGLQTYVVCPMIDANDDMEGVKSVEEVAAEYTKALGPAGIRIATLTGRSTKKETEDIISQFSNGDVDVLIATTVIEVGINVPTATTMVITNAERFGLSALHQLRGRVGRGTHQSYCVLDSDTQTPDGLKRLEAMVNTNDGFKIAEEDLKIRGAGDFLGTRQSGDNKYMALMLLNPEKYRRAQELASKLIDDGTKCKLLDTLEE